VPLPPALALDLRGRSLTRVRDWAPAELEAALDLADELKSKRRLREPHRLLEGATIGLLFRKPSTRTRVSLEVAAAQLGATAVALPADQLQLARGETVEDTALVLSRYLDALAIRTHEHAEVDTFACAATIPVLNALSAEAHPLQALADLQTIRERFGTLDGVRVAWVCDGNNVCVSLAEACALLGAEFLCAAPPGFEPPDPSILVVRDPREAVAGAHVVVTDVWTSMGQDGERAARLAAFAGYTVDAALLEGADAEAIVLHCLPAHPGEEIAADVLRGPRSVVWDEAENRLHTAKAVLALTLGESGVVV
jgi:ornithine carbamoyltransferase